MIHTATSFPIDQPSLRVAHYGPPALAIEICSPTHPAGGCPAAYQHDLDTVSPAAKPQAYARNGIPGYLVYDPEGRVVPNNEDMDTIAEAQQALLAEREARLAEQAARIAELEAELQRRRGE